MILIRTLILFTFFASLQLSLSAQNKPNIVILIADDISYSDLGCYGHPTLKTPNIDQLAENGIKFTNAFLTASSCSPSRVSIITGRYPHNTGGAELHTDMADNQKPFPEMLKNAGYYTAQAGKWHFGSSGEKPSGIALKGFDRTGGGSGDGGGPSGAEMWVSYLKERPKDQPFFMWFAAHDAHRDWDDEIFLDSYTAEDIVIPPYMVDSEKTRLDFVAYYNEVSRFDYFVGEVVKELKDQNVLEQTLLLVMADNGRPFPRDKTTFYDDGIKTPFVIHWPEKIKKGLWSESLLSVIDIAPTLLEVAGLKGSPTFQGRSFVSLFSNPEQKFREYVFAEHNWHDFQAFGRMVRTKDFLYIENGLPSLDNRGAIDVICSDAGEELKAGFRDEILNEFQTKIFNKPQPESEFYHCTDDPNQINNLAGSNNFQTEQKQLSRALKKWKKETGDSKPSMLTPDWYSREDCLPTPEHGKRGIMPGSNKSAEKINKPGPF